MSARIYGDTTGTREAPARDMPARPFDYPAHIHREVHVQRTRLVDRVIAVVGVFGVGFLFGQSTLEPIDAPAVETASVAPCPIAHDGDMVLESTWRSGAAVIDRECVIYGRPSLGPSRARPGV